MAELETLEHARFMCCLSNLSDHMAELETLTAGIRRDEDAGILGKSAPDPPGPL